MKGLVILSFFIFSNLWAHPSLKWSSNNGCVYTLSEDPVGVIRSKSGSWSYQITKKDDGIYYYEMLSYISMHVLCPNLELYCDKTDSIYKKAIEKKENCFGEFLSIDPNMGTVLYVPFEKTWDKDNIFVGCDFVKKVNYKKHDASGEFLLEKEGMCPLWVKQSKGRSIYNLYNLVIENTSEGLNANIGRVMHYSDKKFKYFRPQSFAVGFCKKNNCKIVCIEPNPIRKYTFKLKKNVNDFSIKCDYMHLKSSSDENATAILEIESEGVCPIEIKNDSKKTDTVYVRSFKTTEGFNALISTRDSYEK